jgi:hypothetical protein
MARDSKALLAELEYLQALGQHLIEQCDNALRECESSNLRTHPVNRSKPNDLEN